MAEIVFPRGRVRWHRRRAIDVGTIVFSQQFPQTRDPNRIVINLRTQCAYPIKSQLLICWSLVHCCCATGGGGGDRCHHPPFEHTYATHVHRRRDGRYLGTQPASWTNPIVRLWHGTVDPTGDQYTWPVQTARLRCLRLLWRRTVYFLLSHL